MNFETIKSMDFENIRRVYEKELVGKQFVYVSKYGGVTIGKVANIMVVSDVNMDAETTRKFMIGVAQASQKITVTDEAKKPIKCETWRAARPELYVVSETGMHYNLRTDNVYFM